MSKVVSEDKLIEIRSRSKDKVVGYTSGVFDILHSGHTSYLEKAKKNCDILMLILNSDSSVKLNKGDSRPINSQEDRAAVLSALESVDYILINYEKNNNRLIELLKPDLYIKAGDYQEKDLSSMPIVRSYGGGYLPISFKDGRSTTGIIDKILDIYSLKDSDDNYEKLVLLDRDGTLIEEVPYIHEPEKVKILPGVISGLKKLMDHSFKLVIVTNQPGINFGYFKKEDFFKVNLAMLSKLSKEGIKIDRIHFCPDTLAEDSTHRKPATGMFDDIVKEKKVSLNTCYMIGDKSTDIKFAKNIKSKSILVSTGYAGKEGNSLEVNPDYIASDFEKAADFIIIDSENN